MEDPVFDVSQSENAVYQHPQGPEHIVARLKTARYKRQPSDYITKFSRLVAVWRDETSHFSLLEDKIRHRAFKGIVKLGTVSIPLIIDELRIKPDHLYIALHLITGEDPTPKTATTTSEVIDAWLVWADRNRQYAD